MIDSLWGSHTTDVIADVLLASLWQDAIVCSVTAVLLIALRHRGPEVRYSAACAGLVIMVAVPVATALSAYRDMSNDGRPPINVAIHAPMRAPDRPESLVGALGQIANTDASLATPSRAMAFTWRDVVVLVWAGGVSLFVVRLLRSWIVVERLRRMAVQPVAEKWHERMTRSAQRLRIGRPVQLVQSSLIDVPTVIGWLRPMILLPVSVLGGLPPAQLDAIIAHEMAHIRRHDFVVNLLQAVAETLLFYHPCTWWLSGRIRTERELCCDDMALKVCEHREVYAQALVNLEHLRQMPPLLGLGASSRPLERRVRRILGVPNADEHRAALLLGMSLVVAIAAIAGQTVYTQVAKADAVLRGQVLDAGTTQPVGGASITISRQGDVKTTLTDEDGRYEASGLAAGEYRVNARANGYVPTAYGQRLTAEDSAPVEIQQGRTVSGIDLRLQRSATVHGRIFDVRGNGLAGVEIELLAERYRPGGTTLAPVAFAQTEDLGAYRVRELAPGRYYVRAYAPGSASTGEGKRIYASTYLPGTIERDQAQPIALSAGQELFGADMTLATIEPVTLTGILIDPEHQSFEHTTVVLRSATQRSAQATKVAANGGFRLPDVIPGKYFLVVQEPRCAPADPRCDAAALRSADRWAGVFEPIDVDRDMSDIQLTAGQGARVEGRVTVDSGSAQLNLQNLNVSAVRHLGSQSNVTEAETFFGPARVAHDGTFIIEHARGRTTFEVSPLPDGWNVKSVRIRNRDVADLPIDFGEGTVSDVEIVVTNRLSQLFGRVSDFHGNPVTSYTVIVFPEDRDRWIVPSRLVRGVRSASDALYEIRGLPPDMYLAVAVDSLPTNAWNDLNVLELLRNSGTPFRLEGGERRALNLPLAGTPPNLRER